MSLRRGNYNLLRHTQLPPQTYSAHSDLDLSALWLTW
jgi:hypothetical protein